MLNMKLFIISMVVYSLLLTVFNSSAVSLSVSPEDDDTTIIVEGDKETHLIDEQAINRYGGRADDEFKLRNLFPTHFGEFFEIFVFFMELKWHYELEDAIAAAGERIDQHHNSNGPGAQHKDDNYLLDFAKHYFVNNNTPLWKFKA